jgi:hypothetical protein
MTDVLLHVLVLGEVDSLIRPGPCGALWPAEQTPWEESLTKQ